MGREVRMVHPDWEHPKQYDGRYKPLFKGSYYESASKEFLEMLEKDGLQKAVEWCGCPDKNDYMPVWKDGEATHYMMYEDTSEGTPISPAFETPEELAQWLVNNNASSFGGHTASYEQWLYVVKKGWAPSAVISNGRIQSGVEAMSDE